VAKYLLAETDWPYRHLGNALKNFEKLNNMVQVILSVAIRTIQTLPDGLEKDKKKDDKKEGKDDEQEKEKMQTNEEEDIDEEPEKSLPIKTKTNTQYSQ
jgi:hypothetical protein